MGDLLTRIRRAIGVDSSDAKRSRRWLAHAHRNRTRIDLVELPVDFAGDNGQQSLEIPEDKPVMAASIEDLRPDSIIISQPLVGGVTIPILTGASLYMVFYAERSRVSGVARNLGRAKIPSGAGTPLYGYRLSVPNLHEEGEERRSSYRLPVGIDLAPHVDVVAFGTTVERARGTIENLSVGGALVCLRKPLQGVRQGREIVLDITLPAPVGHVQLRAEVRHVTMQGSGVIVGCQFRTEIEGLDEMVRAMEIRRIQRRRGG